MNYDELRLSYILLLNEKKDEPIIAVEVGTAWGDNAVRMLRACDKLNLTLVDINIQAPLKNAMIEFNDRIKTIEKPSIEAAVMFPDEYFDYVYIDANHTYSYVKDDLIVWYPKVKKGGIFAGHDLADGDVRKAVSEFFKEKQKRVYGIETLWPTGGLESSQLSQMFGTGNTAFIYKTDWWMKKE